MAIHYIKMACPNCGQALELARTENSDDVRWMMTHTGRMCCPVFRGISMEEVLLQFVNWKRDNQRENLNAVAASLQKIVNRKT